MAPEDRHPLGDHLEADKPVGTNTTTDAQERLCVYFGVSIGELVEIVSDRKPKRRKAR